MAAVLDGIRVLDLSSGQVGGIATMILGDFGAEVLKLERPGGDPLRSLTAAPMWLRGKRSVEADLTTSDGRARLLELSAQADVVVTTFRPSTVERLGADYGTLAAANPRLVYCSITGFGPRGPYADYPAYEGLVAAKSGADAGLHRAADARGAGIRRRPDRRAWRVAGRGARDRRRADRARSLRARADRRDLAAAGDAAVRPLSAAAHPAVRAAA